MVALVIIALASAAFGALAWAVSRNRNSFGALLPAGAAVAASLLVWIITMALGLDERSATAWIPWIVSMAAGGATAWATAVVVGRRREAHHIKRTTEILSLH